MLRSGQIVFLCVLALLTIGVVMVNSAGMSIDPKAAVTIESILLSRSTLYMGLAIAAMSVVALLPVRSIADAMVARGPGPMLSLGPSKALPEIPTALVFASVMLLALLSTTYWPVIGREVNGSHRWVGLPTKDSPFTFQPSEIAKWAMVVLMSWYGVVCAPRLPSLMRGLIPGLVPVALVGGFIIVEDLGTGVLVASIACLLLLAAGARIVHFMLFVPFALAAFAAAVIASPYRLQRLATFLDPYAEPQGAGYHMIQSMVAVANGEVFGRGLGFGLQKFGYLPEDRTDFLFAVICEELGVAGAGLVIGLYLVLCWCGLAIVRREPNPILKLVALGVIATVGAQALINLAVVTGLGPTKGIALPMLSSGGTGWILTAASLGLVVSIDRTCPAYSGAGSSRAEASSDHPFDRPGRRLIPVILAPVGRSRARI
jgi:cell division protein FtsW